MIGLRFNIDYKAGIRTFEKVDLWFGSLWQKQSGLGDSVRIPVNSKWFNRNFIFLFEMMRRLVIRNERVAIINIDYQVAK